MQFGDLKPLDTFVSEEHRRPCPELVVGHDRKPYEVKFTRTGIELGTPVDGISALTKVTQTCLRAFLDTEW